MDDVNHESSVDFSDEFEYSYDDASGGCFDNEDDQVEYKCDLLSNSSTSSCYPESDDDEVRRRDIEEFRMDIHDSTNDSVQPIEENNNDPNNNMEGGEELQEENEEPDQSQAVQIIQRPVSPQPGCSKHFDFIENGDFVTREDHRTAVRIQDFLHKIDYLTVIRAHQKRPDLEQHLYRLFDNCTSVKRPYEDTLGDMEKNKKPGKRRLYAKDEDEHNDTIVIESPESYRDTNDISFDRRLSPDDHSKKKENQNVIPIDIDFSDEEIVIEEPNINETKGPTNYHSSNNSKELKAHLPLIQPTRFENREASQERKLSLKKHKFAPSTIVREEQATPITTAVRSTYNPTLKMPGREGLLPATIIKLATAKSSQRPIPSASGASTSFTQNRSLSPTLIYGYVHDKGGTRVMTAQREHNYKSNRPISPIRLNGTRPMTVQREYSSPALPPSPPPAPGPSRATMAIHVHDPQVAERIHHREFGNENVHVGLKRTSEMPALESHSDIKRRRDMTINLDTIVINESTPDIPKNNGKYCREIYTKLRAIFPNINKNYIKKMIPAEWSANVSHDVQFGQIVEQLLANEPNWELDIPTVDANEQQGAGGSTALTVDETYEHLLEIFSNADPTFLRSSAEAMHNNHVALANFIERYSQKQDYPTKEEYLSKMRITEEQLRYTDNFTVAEFLEKFPDPSKHFMDSTRKCKYELVAFEFLKSKFNKIRVNTISQVYNKHSYNMSIAASELAKIKCNMCSTRKHPEMPTNDINILQEIAFIRHREQIEDYLAKKEKAEKDEYERLKKENGLLECQCCYDNECMPSKCASCENGHIFCYSCIIGGTDSRLGDGETHVPCFQGCGSEFSLATLQSVLKPTKFSILVKKRQAAEVAAAGVEGLVSCPFCHFASIPPEGDKVFKCLNPECMKESCIQCKEPNHVPLRCEEVGRADRARKYIEEKMTEALARKCYQCKRAYFKEEGCNKITCPCGAMMCYLCDKKIQDYTHFRGQGCDDMSKCPLYSDNARLNAEKVRKMAQAAKKEMLEQDPSLRIETDHLLPAVPPPSAGPHEQIVQALIPPIAMGVIPMMPIFPEMPPHLPRVRVAHQPRGVYHHHGNPPAPPPQAQYREAYHPPH